MRYSLESFPPKTTDGREALRRTLSRRAFQGAEFVSVTCGAGGDGSRDTESVVNDVIVHGLDAVPHITCAENKEQTISRLTSCTSFGVLCLRGDAPNHAEGFASVLDLLSAVRNKTSKQALCAGYPEPHPDSFGVEQDLTWMRKKQDAGATAVITQYVFDAESILKYRDALHKTAPGLALRPGILPVRDLAGLLRFSARCGARVPSEVVSRLSGHAAGSEGFHKESLSLTAELLDRLKSEGILNVHIYALNDDSILSDLLVRGHLTASSNRAMLAA